MKRGTIRQAPVRDHGEVDTNLRRTAATTLRDKRQSDPPNSEGYIARLAERAAPDAGPGHLA